MATAKSKKKSTKTTLPDTFRMRGDTCCIEFDTAKAKRALGADVLRKLVHALDVGKELFYSKLSVKNDPLKDMISFFDNQTSKYISCRISDLAKAIIIDDNDLESYLPKKKVGQKQLSKKAQQKKKLEDHIVAASNFLSKTFRKSLKHKSYLDLKDTNYWIEFMVKTLNAVPPTEEDICERLIKTYKIYAIAYYVGHKLPVAITRALLRNINSDVSTIYEIPTRQSLLNALHNEINKGAQFEDIHKSIIDIKCQSVYPENKYIHPTVVPGYIENKVSENGEKEIIHQAPPIVSDNVALAFCCQDSVSAVSGDEIYTDRHTLFIYIPGISEKYSQQYAAQETLDIKDLVSVVYQLAISIGYTIMRVDFH